MIVKIRGKTYPSVRAAAEALGVQPVTIHSANSRGRLDYVGLGRGAGRDATNVVAKLSKSVTIGGRTWSSHAELSLWLGKCRKYAATLKSHGDWDRVVILTMRKLAREEQWARRRAEAALEQEEKSGWLNSADSAP